MIKPTIEIARELFYKITSRVDVDEVLEIKAALDTERTARMEAEKGCESLSKIHDSATAILKLEIKSLQKERDEERASKHRLEIELKAVEEVARNNKAWAEKNEAEREDF